MSNKCLTFPGFSFYLCYLFSLDDTLGHKAGDEYIRAACRMLCEYFKHSPYTGSAAMSLS